MSIRISTHQDGTTEKFLKKAKSKPYITVLKNLGSRGVAALASATPKDTGVTAASWDYLIEEGKGSVSIVWTNKNLSTTGTPIAVLLQYGHGTRNGGYVVGRDYINPAMRHIFDKISDEAWKAVIS